MGRQGDGGAELEYDEVLGRALDEGSGGVDDSFGLGGEVEGTRGLGFEFPFTASVSFFSESDWNVSFEYTSIRRYYLGAASPIDKRWYKVNVVSDGVLESYFAEVFRLLRTIPSWSFFLSLSRVSSPYKLNLILTCFIPPAL